MHRKNKLLSKYKSVKFRRFRHSPVFTFTEVISEHERLFKEEWLKNLANLDEGNYRHFLTDLKMTEEQLEGQIKMKGRDFYNGIVSGKIYPVSISAVSEHQPDPTTVEVEFDCKFFSENKKNTT